MSAWKEAEKLLDRAWQCQAAGKVKEELECVSKAMTFRDEIEMELEREEDEQIKTRIESVLDQL